MLEISSLSYQYPKSSTSVFSGLDLKLHPGGIYGLLGSNGAGKSTLLYLMCGLLRPNTGDVIFNGTDVCRRQPATLASIFLVPEDFDLPAVTVEEFVNVNAPFYPKFNREEMRHYLSLFKIDSHPHLGRMSMGQRKKVLISFAIACNTDLLLMDEPTNGLDIPGKSDFRRALIAAMSDTRTVVISTHQVRDLDRVLDHVLIADSGRITLNAPISTLQQRLSFSLESAPDANALFCQPTLGGYSIVRPRFSNDPTDETDVDLESLFELAINRSEMLNSLLS